jgi:Bacteriocin (Lactococcin_972)
MADNRTSLKARFAQVTMGFALVVAAIGVTATSASADSGGGAQRGGVSTASCSNVGGGTWCAGIYLDGLVKHCYSNFVQPDWYHSSTAIMGNAVDKEYASPGFWSEADVYGGYQTCYTYWNTYTP